LIEESESKLIPELSKHAAQLETHEEDELAVDWFNGEEHPMPIKCSKAVFMD
jgi:hypothetical protein